MQIKRFEAADMTDALRLVKRALGDDAVILSAKEVRPRGFFSALRSKHVEITAATDDSADDVSGDNQFTGLLAEQLAEVCATDRVSLSTAPALPDELNRSRPPQPQPSVTVEKGVLDHEMTRGVGHGNRRPTAATPTVAVSTRSSRVMASNGDPIASNAPNRERLAGRTVADPFYTKSHKRRTIALVGPPGSGKSTALVKLAWHCKVVENRRIGLISLDRFRLAANNMLEKAARIMNLPLSVVHDADGLHQVLDRLDDVDVVLIDTPGMTPSEHGMIDDVSRLLRLADPDEIHLVANATVRDEVLGATVETFLPVGPNRLLATHIDACGSRKIVLELVEKTGLAASFYCDGVDLIDALKVAVDGLQTNGVETASTGGQVTAFPGSRKDPLDTTIDSCHDIGSEQYLANRNSELFHHPACKSVKRINAENITAFSSIEQAINEGFKPCRACCNVSMIRKAVTRDASHQRARAI